MLIAERGWDKQVNSSLRLRIKPKAILTEDMHIINWSLVFDSHVQLGMEVNRKDSFLH